MFLKPTYDVGFISFQIKLAGQSIVPSLVFLGQIIHQSFSVGHHLQQTPSGVVVFRMRF